MNQDPDDVRFENGLRALRPVPVSVELENRIFELIDASPPMPLRPAWWERLGFVRPMSALGWGLASPAMAAAVTLMVVHPEAWRTLPSPSAPSANVATESSLRRANLIIPGTETLSAQAANVLEGTFDEGVVPDGGQGLVRQVRYRSVDHVQWRNPRTGAQWEVSYPREDVLLVPINAE